jgi:hypothetical protein
MKIVARNIKNKISRLPVILCLNFHVFISRSEDVMGRQSMCRLEHLFSDTLTKLKIKNAFPL